MTTRRSIANTFEDKFVTCPLKKQQYRDWLATQPARTRRVAAAGEVLTQLARTRRSQRRGG